MSRRLLVAGAGVFGLHLARVLLARTDATIVLAARRAVRLREAASSLGAPDRVEARVVDLGDVRALREAAAGMAVVACAAGPFDVLPRALPSAAVEAGAHWVDLADERGWVLGVLGDESLHVAAREAGVAVLPGRSTVPALSGALVARCRARVDGAYRAAVTLTIGNRNPKGAAAIGAAIAGEFRSPASVSTPLGTLRAWRFDSPDPELLAPELHAEFRVALEWPPAGWIVAAAKRLPLALRMPFARAAAKAGALVAPFGAEGGAVQAEVSDPRGGRSTAALVFPQRVAVAPAAQAIEAILTGTPPGPGVVPPDAWPGADALIDDAVERGAKFFVAVNR